LTQLTAAEVPESHVVDGAPLQTLLTGQTDADRPQQFLMHYPHGPHRSNYFTVWRDGDWKVIYHALPETKTTGGHIQFSDGNYELFNLADDPFESTNLAKSRPKVLKRMMQGLIEALQQHDAVYPVDDAGNVVVPQLP
jgi:arylsulfatase A-like enzyme